MSAALPLPSKCRTSLPHYDTLLREFFVSASHLLFGAVRPVINHGCSEGLAVIVKRPELSSPTLHVVTVRVRPNKKQQTFSRVASRSKSRDICFGSCLISSSLENSSIDSRYLKYVIMCLDLCQQLLCLCLLFD